VAGLTQGSLTLTVEPMGTFFYPTVKLVDLRFAKRIPVGRGRLEGLVDVFNLTNSSAILTTNNQTGASYGNVLTTVNPRIARLGIRWAF
jgi:outer membrane receptor protein involved in Fe transport